MDGHLCGTEASFPNALFQCAELVQVNLRFAVSIYELLSTFKGFLGRLEYLHTEIACMRGIDAAATLDTFSMTPLLRNLVIDGPPDTGHTYTTSFAPSSTVNVLTLDITSLNHNDKHTNVLRGFPHVQDITLFCEKSMVALEHPLILPRVLDLGLTELPGHRGGIADMLSRVVLPCITSLSFAIVNRSTSRSHTLDFPDIRVSDWIKKITVFELGDYSAAGCLRGNNANATIAFLRELPQFTQAKHSTEGLVPFQEYHCKPGVFTRQRRQCCFTAGCVGYKNASRFLTVAV